MSFDISKLDTLNPSELGKKMVLYKGNTREPILNDAGAEVFIQMRGRLSASATNADRQNQIARLDRQKRQIILENDALMNAAEEEMLKVLVACTADWNFDALDGQSFYFSQENALKFWADPRFKKIREQAVAFINEDSNFLSN